MTIVLPELLEDAWARALPGREAAAQVLGLKTSEWVGTILALLGIGTALSIAS